MPREVMDRVGLFAHLSEADRRRVLETGTELELGRDEILFHEGDPAPAFFVLLEGRMKLVRYSEKGRELLIHLVAPGQSFAEAALFGSGTYPATAQAVEVSSVWRLARASLLRLVRADPELGISMMASIAMWTRRVVGTLQLMTQRRVEERLAVYLLSRAGERALAPGDVVAFGVPKHLVAALCGTAPEVLSRTFRKLEEAGVLAVGSETVTVLDPRQLRELAEWIDDGDGGLER
jgi:CRP/FNR family transcriptional regulator